MFGEQTSQSEDREERFNIRTKSSVKRVIERAASLSGQKVSDFLLVDAFRRAKKIVADHSVMTLEGDDQQAFVAAFLDVSEPSERLQKAAQKFKASHNV